MAENWDLKRMNAGLRTEVLQLKKALKETSDNYEQAKAKAASLNFKINEYISLEKNKWE